MVLVCIAYNYIVRRVQQSLYVVFYLLIDRVRFLIFMFPMVCLYVYHISVQTDIWNFRLEEVKYSAQRIPLVLYRYLCCMIFLVD